MLRNEVQERTGLTRKAIEYYEERGLIKPQKLENGYRDYSIKDLETLKKISLYRKVGISLCEIERLMSSRINILSSILRDKEYQIEIDEKKRTVLEMIINGDDQEVIIEKMSLIESEETIYQRLERAFPGYLGQMFFCAYQPFLNEPLTEQGENAYKEYVKFLDELPVLELTDKERIYIEEISPSLNMDSLKEINKNKINAIKNFNEWIKENKDIINQYEAFKNSEEYLSSPIKQIKDKLQKFMIENKYYETAIPLIRKFSRSYDEYYKKLVEADENYTELLQ